MNGVVLLLSLDMKKQLMSVFREERKKIGARGVEKMERKRANEKRRKGPRENGDVLEN